MNAPTLLGLIFAGWIGAVFGSFMSVIVTRLPPLLHASATGRASAKDTLSNLSWPSSHCRRCQTPLHWYDNIPIFSFILLQGRCRACDAPYGTSYFMLEMCAAGAAITSFLLFGWTVQFLLIFALLAILISLCVIDFREMLLPDALVFPLVPLGLLFQFEFGRGVLDGLVGGLAGFSTLWCVSTLYRFSRKQDGMGGGDLKLAGALGIWIGVEKLPWFFLLSFAGGLLFMSLLIAARLRTATSPFPFGPFLALSAAILILLPTAPLWLGGLFAI